MEKTLEELWEFFPDAKWITSDEDKNIKLFINKPAIIDDIWGGCGNWSIGDIEIEEFVGLTTDEMIAERPVDYTKWIGKLGVFADDNHPLELKKDKKFDLYYCVGILNNITSDRFSNGYVYFDKFRPLTAEEVKGFIAE